MSSSEQRHATWRRLLAEQQASGESITGWCDQHGISLASFYYWRKRVTNDAAPAAPQWLALPATATHDPLLLHVSRVTIEVARGFDAQLLHEVLAVLESR